MIKLKGILTIKLNNMVNLSKLRYNVGCSYIIPDKINQKIPSSVFFNVRDYKEDIIQDFVSIITSFTARLYGQRRTKRKTEELIRALENDKNI